MAGFPADPTGLQVQIPPEPLVITFDTFTLVIEPSTDPRFDDHHAACLLLRPGPCDIGAAFPGWLILRPDLDEADRRSVYSWAEQRIRRTIEPDGSEPDTWYPRSDGLVQVYARRVALPPWS